MRKSLVLLLIAAFLFVGFFGSCTKKEEAAEEPQQAVEEFVEEADYDETDLLVEEFEEAVSEYVEIVNMGSDPDALESIMLQIADIAERMEAIGEDEFSQEQLDYIKQISAVLPMGEE